MTWVGCSLLALTLATSATAQSAQAAPAVDEPAAVSTADEQARVAQARSLIMAGNRPAAAEAYALLAPLESAWSGDTDFNYLLGLAALEAGKPSEAVFALLRAVAAEPGFAGARIELARAYFEAGDNEDARREFEIASGQDPPPAAAAVIRRYLDAIDRKAQRYRSAWQGAAELSGGYDSNANGGTSDANFLGFDLNDASRETESSFIGAEGQVGYSSPLTPVLGWRAGADARHREYPDASFVTQTSGRLRTGLAALGADWQLVSDVSAEILALDGKDNRRVVALDLSGNKQMSATTTGIASLRAAQLRYDDELDVQDVDQWVGALTLQWRPLAARRWQFQLGPVGGREDARDSGSPFGRDLIGARAQISAVSRGWIWQAALGSLASDYDGEFFGEERKDRQSTLQFQVEMPGVFRTWIVRPSLSYVDNHSDIALYDYSRIEAGLHLQRRW